MKTRDQAIAQMLIGIQTQVEALILFIAGDGSCEHPAHRRDDLTTFGGPERWICKDCGYEFNGAVNG